MTENDVELTPVREHHRFDEASLWRYLGEHIDDEFAASVRQFEGGQSNPTFLIETGKAKYVLRKKPPGQLLKSAHQVDREYRVMAALADTSVPVPKMYVLCDDDSIIGTAFYVMEHVEGRVLIDSFLPSFSPTERRAVYKSFVESLAALHSIDHIAVGLEGHGRPGNYYARQIHRWSEQYKASETESIAEMNQVMAWLPENIPEDDETSIVHGDYRLGNCIIHPTEPRIAAILDWELSTIGHPLADLSYWCSMEYHSQKEFPKNHKELGLPSEQELLDQYCELTGRAGIDNWTFYIAFNLFRTAGIRQGVYKRGLDGNASSERWRESGPGAKASAIRAWELVRDAGLA